MRDSVRWRKQSRIVLMLAQELNITEEEALDLFYNSRTYTLFADPSRGLQAMSDRYIVDEILLEVGSLKAKELIVNENDNEKQTFYQNKTSYQNQNENENSPLTGNP